MTPLIGILARVILPLMGMVGAGVLLGRTARLDVRTLSKLNVYLLVPSFLFSKFYRLDLPLAQAQTVVLFTAGVMAGMAGVGGVLAWAMKLPRGLATALVASVAFYNSGNYGLSVMELVFGRESPAMEIQALVLTTQAVSNFSVGVVLISAGSQSWRRALENIVRYPIVPSFVVALALRWSGIQLPPFITIPVERIALALVPMGLVTLGVQIAQVRGVRLRGLLSWSVGLRLLGGPVLGTLLIILTGIPRHLAPVLLISCAAPTAVNTALLGIEFENEAEFASQAVLFSTLASVFTVTVVIYMAQRLWPLL